MEQKTENKEFSSKYVAGRPHFKETRKEYGNFNVTAGWFMYSCINIHTTTPTLHAHTY
jgi:hypothetical protein